MSEIKTDGGSVVGGNVRADGFTGRDASNNTMNPVINLSAPADVMHQLLFVLTNLQNEVARVSNKLDYQSERQRIMEIDVIELKRDMITLRGKMGSVEITLETGRLERMEQGRKLEQVESQVAQAVQVASDVHAATTNLSRRNQIELAVLAAILAALALGYVLQVVKVGW